MAEVAKKREVRFRCQCCEKLKPATSKVMHRFSPSKKAADGLVPICNECERAIKAKGFDDVLNYKHWFYFQSRAVLIFLNIDSDFQFNKNGWHMDSVVFVPDLGRVSDACLAIAAINGAEEDVEEGDYGFLVVDGVDTGYAKTNFINKNLTTCVECGHVRVAGVLLSDKVVGDMPKGFPIPLKSYQLFPNHELDMEPAVDITSATSIAKGIKEYDYYKDQYDWDEDDCDDGEDCDGCNECGKFDDDDDSGISEFSGGSEFFDGFSKFLQEVIEGGLPEPENAVLKGLLDHIKAMPGIKDLYLLEGPIPPLSAQISSEGAIVGNDLFMQGFIAALNIHFNAGGTLIVVRELPMAPVGADGGKGLVCKEACGWHFSGNETCDPIPTKDLKDSYNRKEMPDVCMLFNKAKAFGPESKS